MASEGGDGAARLAAMAETWRSDLLTNVLPFWLKNSVDTECGGERTHKQLLKSQCYNSTTIVWRFI
jgi:mannose/cellobiose epimerase-like protein (N-acyl-D-glucosamine 2-epimerase family)